MLEAAAMLMVAMSGVACGALVPEREAGMCVGKILRSWGRSSQKGRTQPRLVLRAATLAGSTTFPFHSITGVWSASADHLVKVASGHLVMSRLWIILQVVPWGAMMPHALAPGA